MRRQKILLLLLIGVLFAVGCAGATGKVYADDPMERGLSYIAAAIVTHGILQILFRR